MTLQRETDVDVVAAWKLGTSGSGDDVTGIPVFRIAVTVRRRRASSCRHRRAGGRRSTSASASAAVCRGIVEVAVRRRRRRAVAATAGMAAARPAVAARRRDVIPTAAKTRRASRARLRQRQTQQRRLTTCVAQPLAESVEQRRQTSPFFRTRRQGHHTARRMNFCARTGRSPTPTSTVTRRRYLVIAR